MNYQQFSDAMNQELQAWLKVQNLPTNLSIDELWEPEGITFYSADAEGNQVKRKLNFYEIEYLKAWNMRYVVQGEFLEELED
jgi:hypothetical protein